MYRCQMPSVSDFTMWGPGQLLPRKSDQFTRVTRRAVTTEEASTPPTSGDSCCSHTCPSVNCVCAYVCLPLATILAPHAGGTGSRVPTRDSISSLFVSIFSVLFLNEHVLHVRNYTGKTFSKKFKMCAVFLPNANYDLHIRQRMSVASPTKQCGPTSPCHVPVCVCYVLA